MARLLNWSCSARNTGFSDRSSLRLAEQIFGDCTGYGSMRGHDGSFLMIRSGIRLAIAALTVVATLAATMGTAAAANPISEPIINRGVEVELTPWVQIPNTTRGTARLNHFATTGERLFVVEDFDGRIYEINGRGDAELFFDVKATIAAVTPRRLDNTSIPQGGLRAVAFHPEFDQNGLLYTTHMETRSADLSADLYLSNVANPIIADGVLVEWQVDASGRVDPDSYRQVFRVGMPVYDHAIKQAMFNPFTAPGDADYGVLYVAHGDGSTQAATLGGGQNNDALGKILRIDPTEQPNGDRFAVPGDNPFLGDASMLDEVYSLGHRNPHHLSFHSDGQLIVAEVGRGNVEEINLIEPGGNYGWSRREGTFVHVGGGLVTGVQALPANEADFGFVFPAAQWGHDGVVGDTFTGQGIAGSHVIENGSALDGEYFHADFATSGRLFHTNYDELQAAVTTLNPGQAPTGLTQAPVATPRILFDHDSNPFTDPLVRSDLRDVFNDSSNYDGSGRADVRFGQGVDGELYISSKRTGIVYLVTNSLPSSMLCDGHAATVDGLVGTDGRDVIIGTGTGDLLRGLGGDDLICGRGGDDTIDAGAGNDTVFAGDGADVVRGKDGNDSLSGDDGDDLIFGGRGVDFIRGDAGNDELRGGLLDDMLLGGQGDDVLFGQRHNDDLRGGAGDDVLRGGAGPNNVARGGAGFDECRTVVTAIGCER